MIKELEYYRYSVNNAIDCLAKQDIREAKDTLYRLRDILGLIISVKKIPVFCEAISIGELETKYGTKGLPLNEISQKLFYRVTKEIDISDIENTKVVSISLVIVEDADYIPYRYKDFTYDLNRKLWTY